MYFFFITFKRIIAKKAAKLISDGDVIFLDAVITDKEDE